jgi:prepilin-type processing-associated H-X9-DG protein
MVEYDPATFAEKQTVKVPPESAESPQNLLVNHLGQMLFAAPVALPLAEGDVAAERNVWFWDGHAATTLTREIMRATSTTGSNLAISESAATPALAADGTHLYWFSNQARRLQRDGVDLSTRTTWQSWRTDLAGAGHEDVASIALPDCPCPTGSCEETCPYGEVWVPDDGVGKFFVITQFVSGKTQPIYKASSFYDERGGKWTATALDPPLRRALDAANADAILEAIPDTSCCGWENQSDDQTVLRLHGKTLNVFDELSKYKNPDFDVSFYTENGKLSPDLSSVASTIVATAQPNTAIQLAEQGQANPEESQHLRKALLDLPAVEVTSVEDFPRRIAFLPLAELVGWMSDKEILIVEGHLLVAYNVATGARRKSSIRVENAGLVFLR